MIGKGKSRSSATFLERLLEADQRRYVPEWLLVVHLKLPFCGIYERNYYSWRNEEKERNREEGKEWNGK